MSKVVNDLKEEVFGGFNWAHIRKAIQQASSFECKRGASGDVFELDLIKDFDEVILRLNVQKYKDLYLENRGYSTDIKNIRYLIRSDDDIYQSRPLLNKVWKEDLEISKDLKPMLIELGFLTEDRGYLELTDKFNLLLKQKNQKRISLKTACDKLAKAIKTAHEFNLNESNRNPVKLIVLYGSTSRLESEVGDIDIHITTTERMFDKEYTEFRANDRKLTLIEKPSLKSTHRQFSASSQGYAKKAIKKTSPYIDADDSIPVDELISDGGLICFCDTPIGCARSIADARVTNVMHNNLKKLSDASGSKKLLEVSQLLLERG